MVISIKKFLKTNKVCVSQSTITHSIDYLLVSLDLKTLKLVPKIPKIEISGRMFAKLRPFSNVSIEQRAMYIIHNK